MSKNMRSFFSKTEKAPDREYAKKKGRKKKKYQSPDESYGYASKSNEPYQQLEREFGGKTPYKVSKAGNRKKNFIPRKESAVLLKDQIDEIIEEAIRSEKTAPYARTKLMVVGEGRAGKTCTINRLLNKGFDENEESTRGFDVSRVHTSNWKEDTKGYMAEQLEKIVKEEQKNKKLNKMCTLSIDSVDDPSLKDFIIDEEKNRKIDVDEKEVKKYGDIVNISGSDGEDALAFSIWDFGGQKVFYSLHHLFLTEYGCYLLVFNLKHLIDETKVNETTEYIKFWLFSKKIHASSAPILLVGTHGNELTEKELSKVERYISVSILGKNTFAEVRSKKRSFFVIDNLTGQGIEELRRAIEINVKKQEYIKRCIPLSFLRVIELLLERKEEYLCINQAKKIVTSCGLDDKYFQAALTFLAERGLVTYFGEHSKLRNFVILQPQWLISAFTDVLFDDKEHEQPDFDNEFNRDFRKFTEERVLSRELLGNIWMKKGYTESVQNFFIEIMKASSLMCNYNFDDAESYLVPSLYTAKMDWSCTEEDEEYSGPKFVLDFSGNYDKDIVADGGIFFQYIIT